MGPEKIKEILEKIKNLKVSVYGDFCIDAYWILGPGGSEISLETGLKGEAVKEHYYSLGGASNIVANLSALYPQSINAIGVIGDDIFGREIKRQFRKLKISTDFLVIQKENYSTVAFGKRIFKGREEPRIDFGFFNKRSIRTDKILLEGIEHAIKYSDVLIFNQQVPGSITNMDFIEKVNFLFKKYNDRIVLSDSRHYKEQIKNVYMKMNIFEAAELVKFKGSKKDLMILGNVKLIAMNLFNFSKKPVFITRGPEGIAAFDSNGFHSVPGIKLFKKRDTVGAGDTTISALALSLASGEDIQSAIEFANLAATVVVQKLFRTGVATGEEILAISKL